MAGAVGQQRHRIFPGIVDSPVPAGRGHRSARSEFHCLHPRARTKRCGKENVIHVLSAESRHSVRQILGAVVWVINDTRCPAEVVRAEWPCSLDVRVNGSVLTGGGEAGGVREGRFGWARVSSGRGVTRNTIFLCVAAASGPGVVCSSGVTVWGRSPALDPAAYLPACSMIPKRVCPSWTK